MPSKWDRMKRGGGFINRQRLKFVFKKHDGVCQNCGCGTLMAWQAQQLGWKIENSKGVVVSPTGATVRIATVQHIVSLGEGGGNYWSNLTLFCMPCQWEDSNRLNEKRKKELESLASGKQSAIVDGEQTGEAK